MIMEAMVANHQLMVAMVAKADYQDAVVTAAGAAAAQTAVWAGKSPCSQRARSTTTAAHFQCVAAMVQLRT